MAASIQGGIHRLHDQNTALVHLPARVCTPHFLVLPISRGTVCKAKAHMTDLA